MASYILTNKEGKPIINTVFSSYARAQEVRDQHFQGTGAEISPYFGVAVSKATQEQKDLIKAYNETAGKLQVKQAPRSMQKGICDLPLFSTDNQTSLF